MEVEGAYPICSDIQKLPEECISLALSLTSPRDACRSEAVSPAFQSAAISDDVWKHFLPSDLDKFLARAVDPVEFASMKHLYFRLCDPVLIDGGKMGFYLDRETGAKCFILAARELGIIWGDTPQYWRWIDHPESRFSEVAELLNVCWLEIRGRINTRMLSKWTNYSAYLIFKVSNARGFGHPLQEASIALGAHISRFPVCLLEAKNYYSRSLHPTSGLRRPRFMLNFLRHARRPQLPLDDLQHPPNNQPMEAEEDEQDDQRQTFDDAEEPRNDRQLNQQADEVVKPKIREDGWMEILLGEFFNEEGDDGEVVMSLLEIKGGNWKSGLVVQGIEIRCRK